MFFIAKLQFYKTYHALLDLIKNEKNKINKLLCKCKCHTEIENKDFHKITVIYLIYFI